MLGNSSIEKVYQVIKNDIDNGNGKYSTLTNTKIAKILDMSAFTVRDKVLELNKKKYITTVNDIWLEERFHNRIIYLK